MTLERSERRIGTPLRPRLSESAIKKSHPMSADQAHEYFPTLDDPRVDLMNGICPCERPPGDPNRPPQSRRNWQPLRRVMPLLACTGHPVIQAGNAREAARSFADLLAKSKYGAGGECTFLAPIPGNVLAFQALIGNFRALALRLTATSRYPSSCKGTDRSLAMDTLGRSARFGHPRSGGAGLFDQI